MICIACVHVSCVFSVEYFQLALQALDFSMDREIAQFSWRRLPNDLYDLYDLYDSEKWILENHRTSTGNAMDWHMEHILGSSSEMFGTNLNAIVKQWTYYVHFYLEETLGGYRYEDILYLKDRRHSGRCYFQPWTYRGSDVACRNTFGSSRSFASLERTVRFLDIHTPQG